MTTKTKSKPNKAAIGKCDAAPKADQAREDRPNTPRPGSKIGKVIAILERKEGATLAEMTKTTGWQVHSVRAALTGLKKKGYELAKSRRDDVTCYRITGKA